MTDSARILVVDNYDSFVYTIVGYLKTVSYTHLTLPTKA